MPHGGEQLGRSTLAFESRVEVREFFPVVADDRRVGAAGFDLKRTRGELEREHTVFKLYSRASKPPPYSSRMWMRSVRRSGSIREKRAFFVQSIRGLPLNSTVPGSLSELVGS